MGIHGRCRYPRLAIRHSLNQEALVLAKYEILRPFTGTPPKTQANGGWGGPLKVFTTLSQRDFADVYALCYPNGIKTISSAWLACVEERGLAWWFMDDGTRNTAGISLSTESFSYREQEILKTWFLTRWGIAVYITHSKRSLWFIRLRKLAAHRFCQLVAPHLIPTMGYKLFEAQSAFCLTCGFSFIPQRQGCEYCSERCYKAHKSQIDRERYARLRSRILEHGKRIRLLNRLKLTRSNELEH